MLAYHVKDTVIDVMKNKISCLKYAYDPANVSVWQIKKGCLDGMDNKNFTIQDGKHLIRKNFFNTIMGKVMDDFNNMINFYEP